MTTNRNDHKIGRKQRPEDIVTMTGNHNYIADADADAVSQFRFVFSYANGNRKYASQAITKNDSHENEIRQSMQIKLTLYYAIHSYVSYKLLEITLKVFCITTGIILMHD